MTQVSSLYIHVPFCRHLCNYCDFYKRKYEPGSTQFEDFHRFLVTSWQRHEQLMTEKNVNWSPLSSVYLGGGTPSLWGIDGAKFFEKSILSKIKILPDAEFTMEVDPGTWSPEMIEAWQKLGLNRISIGTQTLSPEFLKIMDRDHSLEESFSLLKFCQDNRWNFSLDFLLGLPFSREKKRNIKNELEALLSFAPKHISLYILNARSKYPFIQNMPDDEFIREEYLFVSEFLKKAGFHHYEVSNFALPGFEAQHNVKYWRSESVAALGPTGTGYFHHGETSTTRYKWKVSESEVELEKLGDEELSLEKTYLELRTSLGWKPRSITDPLLKVFGVWEKANYGRWDGERLKLSALGFVMLDSLMDDLFRTKIKL